MSGGRHVCAECGVEFYSRSSYIMCERCINIAMYGYNPIDETEHTNDYYCKTFRQLNEKLLNECHAADACGKSYGYYKADIRRILRDGRK